MPALGIGVEFHKKFLHLLAPQIRLSPYSNQPFALRAAQYPYGIKLDSFPITHRLLPPGAYQGSLAMLAEFSAGEESVKGAFSGYPLSLPGSTGCLFSFKKPPPYVSLDRVGIGQAEYFGYFVGGIPRVFSP